MATLISLLRGPVDKLYRAVRMTVLRMTPLKWLFLSFYGALFLISPSFATEQSIAELLEKQEVAPSEEEGRENKDAPETFPETQEEDDISSQVRYIQTSAIVLNILDKITARVSEVHGNIGQKITFGNLEILPLACYKTPADEKPESAARLKIYDLSKGRDVTVFSGWMFASSPALSALEHPIYDVGVKECAGLEHDPL